MDAVEFAPLRPLSDFLLSSARFQPPSLADPSRWGNRVMNNLLYYQSNYFVTFVLTFLLVGLLHPVHMLTGVLATAVALALYVYATENAVQLRRLKQKHPVLGAVVIFTTVYLVINAIGGIFVFLFGIALPTALVIVHASLRMRNLSNKVSRLKGEFVGIKRTPMGLLLESLGQEQEAGS